MLVDEERMRQRQIKLDLKEKIEIAKEKNQSILTYIVTSEKARQKFKEQEVNLKEFLAHKNEETRKLQERIADVES